MMCPHFTKDAAGIWSCGARGRNCVMKYNAEIFCEVKPVMEEPHARPAI